jgi:hypothetical protein
MCNQFERNAAQAHQECDKLRELLKSATSRAESLEQRLNAAHAKINADRVITYAIGDLYRTEVFGITARIHTFNSAPLWRRILTAIRGDL